MPKTNITSTNKGISSAIWFVVVAFTALVLGMVVYNAFLDKQKLNAKSQPALNERISSGVEFKLIDGSVYKVTETQNLLVVDKNDLPDTQFETSTIISFTLSPDGSKILVAADGGLSIPVLFYKNIYAGDIVPIGPGNDSVWSKNSLYIAYKRANSDIGPYHVQVYDTSTNTEIDITTTTDFENTTYGKIIWADDSKTFQAEFIQYDMYPDGKVTKKGFEKITVIK